MQDILVRTLSFTFVCLSAIAYPTQATSEHHFWIAGSDGVEWCSLDSETGELRKIKRVSDHSLTWLAIHRGRFLYGGSVLKDAADASDGALSAFRIEPDHSLTFLNQVPSSGKTTIYLSIDPTGRALFAVNFRQDTYTSRGSVVAFSLKSNGSIGLRLQRFEHPGKGGSKSNRQLASHPHSIVRSPNQQFVAVADLGVDKVFIYRIQPNGHGLKLASEIKGRPGQQPRHLAWHPNGRFIYTMNEAAPTVSVASFDPDTGKGEFIQHLKRIQFKGGGGADIRIDSKGRYLYGTNRGENTIVAFEVNPETGRIQLLGHTPTGGPSSRSIAISPDDRWLIAANQGNDLVKVFAIERGLLRESSSQLEIKNPACVLFAEPTRQN